MEGHVDEGFGRVADAFRRVMEAETGAAIAAHVDGRLVVDLWAGVSDPAAGSLWQEDTATLVFSASKGVLALCAGMLRDRGLMDFDAPVAEYWPEYAAGGKSATTVRMLLTHRAGLPLLDRRLTFDEVLAWTPVIQALESQRPRWRPGSGHGYHAMTFGWLVGEVIRRLSGMTPGEFVAQELSGLAVNAWFGVPAGELGRVATLLPSGDAAAGGLAAPHRLAESRRAADLDGALPFPGPFDVGVWNDPRLLQGQIPAANLVATARDLGRIYSCSVSGDGPGRLLSPDTVRDMLVPQSEGEPVFGASSPRERWGSGFLITSRETPMLGPGSFGHHGAGGALAFGDLDARAAFAYVNNRMRFPPDSANTLARALAYCLG